MNENYLKNIIISIVKVFLNVCLVILLAYAIKYSTYDQKDVNRDGKINSQDYVIIKNYIMEKEYNYDVNDDGKTDIEDLLLLQKYLIGGE